jgi:hypothetical protein
LIVRILEKVGLGKPPLFQKSLELEPLPLPLPPGLQHHIVPVASRERVGVAAQVAVQHIAPSKPAICRQN